MSPGLGTSFFRDSGKEEKGSMAYALVNAVPPHHDAHEREEHSLSRSLYVKSVINLFILIPTSFNRLSLINVSAFAIVELHLALARHLSLRHD